MAKTTKKDFRLFKKECRKWIEYFGLKQWDIHFFHNECDTGWAEFYSDIEGKNFTVTLSTKFPNYKNITKRRIRLIAFHEVVEGIMLTEIRDMLFERGYNRRKIDKKIHTVVRILENTVFK